MTALLILFTTAIVVLFAGLTKSRQLLQPIALTGSLLALGATAYDLLSGTPNKWNDMYAGMFRFTPYALAFSP